MCDAHSLLHVCYRQDTSILDLDLSWNSIGDEAWIGLTSMARLRFAQLLHLLDLRISQCRARLTSQKDTWKTVIYPFKEGSAMFSPLDWRDRGSLGQASSQLPVQRLARRNSRPVAMNTFPEKKQFTLTILALSFATKVAASLSDMSPSGPKLGALQLGAGQIFCPPPPHTVSK